MSYDGFSREEVQGQVEELLERFAAQGHGQKMFGMTLVEALMDLADDVALHPYEVPNVEPIDDGAEVFIDWSTRNGYQAICSRHGKLPHFWQPTISEPDKHDFTVILGWDHMRREHQGPDRVWDGMLINPEKHDAIIRQLRNR